MAGQVWHISERGNEQLDRLLRMRPDIPSPVYICRFFFHPPPVLFNDIKTSRDSLLVRTNMLNFINQQSANPFYLNSHSSSSKHIVNEPSPLRFALPAITGAAHTSHTSTPQSAPVRRCTPHPLQLPEILDLILGFLDCTNPIPSEPAPARRKPLSLRHARLIYPTEGQASAAWEAACRDDNRIPQHTTAGVYNCLTVNSEWYDSARRVLSKRLFFDDQTKWENFASQPFDRMANTLVLHKLKTTTQTMVNKLYQPRLEWLEFYVCPNLLPSPSLLSQFLKRLALPGSARVDDEFLALVANNCPYLETLDLRACEAVSDTGLVFIADRCPNLKYLNVGRIEGGHMITCRGVGAISRQTQVDTLGLAGCDIGDSGMWDIAQYRGDGIERLSLNGCKLLTNRSIPLILRHTPNLQVLELRQCTLITNVRPIIEFKRRGQPLVEGCEIFEERMRDEERKMAREERKARLSRSVEHGPQSSLRRRI
ncbi:Antagonist of mitotic exit network protein 1 [Neolecta irregularis DAH-3]|uniref:Antagonist of mitotic exit network protein 1 n=1 Tax=Neolecta irregularis (strain DAH-3) TaxID=1198029 RepID=A0A1U7LKI5_NEOID|nr:Antagonist of mitotic exit network protein 1 [Neolecta irregularis DAH-3]|eukprot:OLL23164.1 Antagonist of mitotic exit network protein 1 [Neolecta irregularis DAH-3]